jgi:hypothetical protein
MGMKEHGHLLVQIERTSCQRLVKLADMAPFLCPLLIYSSHPAFRSFFIITAKQIIQIRSDRHARGSQDRLPRSWEDGI